MANKKLHVQASPLTNTIFCGHVSKDGTYWLGNKTDVTIECLFAVYHHIKSFGSDVVITDTDCTKISMSISVQTPTPAPTPTEEKLK